MSIEALPQLEAHYRLLREQAGLLERTGRGILAVTGPDAADFLQGQITNDVLALEPGRGCYALLLNPKGHVRADLRVLSFGPQELWIDTEPGTRETLVTNLRTYTIGREVEIADRSDEKRVLSLLGPRSEAVAPGAAVEDLERPADEHSWLAIEIARTPVVAAATDLGLDLIVDAESAGKVREALLAEGAAEIGEEAAEAARIASGRPRYGLDMTEDNLPGELGLEARAVSFTKGCYVGQEPVARMHHRGRPNRHLRGLRLSDAAAPGTALLRGEKQVGAIGSSCVSPELGAIALALVRREVVPGEQVDVGSERSPAKVVELPFEDGG